VRSRMPEPREAHLLRMPLSVPILETVITAADGADVPIFFGFARYCSERVELVLDV